MTGNGERRWPDRNGQDHPFRAACHPGERQRRGSGRRRDGHLVGAGCWFPLQGVGDHGGQRTSGSVPHPRNNGGSRRRDRVGKGARPTITSAPVTVAYSQTFAVGTPNAAQVNQVRWIWLGFGDPRLRPKCPGQHPLLHPDGGGRERHRPGESQPRATRPLPAVHPQPERSPLRRAVREDSVERPQLRAPPEGRD